MRQKDREITGREEHRGRSCQSLQGLPRRHDRHGRLAVRHSTVNFGYTWDEDGLTLYCSGVKGKKIDSLRADPRAVLRDGLRGRV